MNILQISTHDNKGGAAKTAWTLKEGLEKRDCTTSMFVRYKYSSKSNVNIIKPNIFQLLLSYFLASDIDFSQSNNILKTKQYHHADIIQCHNLHGHYFSLETLEKMVHEKPVVWTLHDMWALTPHCAHAFNGKLKNGFYQCPNINIYPPILWHNEKYLESKKRKIYRNAHLHLVVTSQWLKDKVQSSILGNQPITLIHYGVDNKIFKKFSKEKARKMLSLPLDKKIVIIVADGGKKNPWKGQEYIQGIINFYSHDNNLLFLYIGGNRNDQKLNTKNIKYISFIFDKSILASYYSASDLFLLTSIADNFPFVILEAMACGVPVVSFDVGGVKEAVIHKKNGYIAKYRDIKDVINGINYIFNLNNNEKNIMYLNSIERINKYFTINIMVKKYLDLYKSLLKT